MRISDWSSDVCSSDLLTPNAIGRIGWASDSRSFVYTEVNDNWRAYRARLHRLGASPDTDITLYEEHDPGFSVGVGLTQDRTLLRHLRERAGRLHGLDGAEIAGPGDR